MLPVETALAALSLFEKLRPDEIGRIARHFKVIQLADGATHEARLAEDARMFVVVAGGVELTCAEPGGRMRAFLAPGDRFGDNALCTGRWREVLIVARGPATLAAVDKAGFDEILRDFPAVALPLAAELASTLRAAQDVERQVLELSAEGLPPAQLKHALEQRRRVSLRRGARVARLRPGAIFRWLVVQRGAEPQFWMLLGLVLSVILARGMVALIFKFKLEHQLFALVSSPNDPNPLHVHHFNYGLMMIGGTGLAALFPLGRKALRVLAFFFGFGFGLVLDEFTLFWNLNPSYEHARLTSAIVAGALLLQLVYFRRFWGALVRRAADRVRGSH